MPSETLVERYRDAGLALLPPGRAIAKRLGSNVADLFEGIAVEFARIHEDSATLLRNSLPTTASEMLDEWEEALDLPGSCVTTPSTDVSERAGAVAAKLRGRTSHSRSTFENAALGLGYDYVEFAKLTVADVGSASIGDSLYGDHWANVVVTSVLVGDQTADEELQCIFTDQLRRSHGYFDIRMEGVMGAVRTQHEFYHNEINLGADVTEAAITELVELKYQGFLSAQCIIDNGAGAAPSDTPIGVWRLYGSVDGETFTEIVSSDITTELALIAPNGNNVVGAWAVFTNVPGRYVKLAYDRTSGGGGNSSCTVHLTTW